MEHHWRLYTCSLVWVLLLVFRTSTMALRPPYLSAVRCPGLPLFRCGLLHSQQLGSGSPQYVCFNTGDSDLALLRVGLLRSSTKYNFLSHTSFMIAVGLQRILALQKPIFLFKCWMRQITHLSLHWGGFQELRLRGRLLNWRSFGLDRSRRLLDEQSRDLLQDENKRFSTVQRFSELLGLTDWSTDAYGPSPVPAAESGAGPRQ